MPELPDLVVYCEAIKDRIAGQNLENLKLPNPFLLRTAVPPISVVIGNPIANVFRLGKRIVFAVEPDYYLVLHLMIAGRLRWLAPLASVPQKLTQAVFEFGNGKLVFTEAGSKRRASLHLVQGLTGLAQFNLGGMEILEANINGFSGRLKLENHTLKRALTDPRLFSGIGNAYSDEILHRAKLSPLAHTQKLLPDQIERLFGAARQILSEWTHRLRSQADGDFPVRVTAFRPEMAVHGRFGQPCPSCGAPVQRIVYAENECNYCPVCQTRGIILADRALSRLLHKSWPKSIDELG